MFVVFLGSTAYTALPEQAEALSAKFVSSLSYFERVTGAKRAEELIGVRSQTRLNTQKRTSWSQ